MSAVCPCCGKLISNKELIVDLDTNTIIFNGKSAKPITRRTTELIFTLADKWPKAVSLTDLSFALWGGYEPTRARECIAVYVSYARRTLVPMDLVIENVYGRGFRLVKPGQPK